MRVLPYGETVVLRRRVLALDGDGEVVRNGYGEAQYATEEIPIPGCSVAPAGSAGQAFSFEAVGGRSSQVSVRYIVHMPAGNEHPDANDRVFWHGLEWEIEGESGATKSPFSGRLGPIELYLKRVTG